MWVYQAVLDHGIRTYDEFRAWHARPLADGLSTYSSASKPGGPHGIAGMEPASRTGPTAGPQVRENHWIVAAVRSYRAAVPRRPGKGVPLYTV